MLDSSSIGNYIIDKSAQDFNLIIQRKQKYEHVTLAKGQRCKCRDMSTFDYVVREIIMSTTQSFQNLNYHSIIGILWLKQKPSHIRISHDN